MDRRVDSGVYIGVYIVLVVAERGVEAMGVRPAIAAPDRVCAEEIPDDKLQIIDSMSPSTRAQRLRSRRQGGMGRRAFARY